MKTIVTFLSIICFGGLTAQDNEKAAVQKTIETFFEGFHQKDSLLMKNAVDEHIIMQRISEDSLGNTVLRTDDFAKFLKAIVGRPADTKYEEILKSYSIQIDGPMANAWTPYEFKLNDAFHHCGVNSFQLAKMDDGWKIIYIVDTGRTEGCE